MDTQSGKGDLPSWLNDLLLYNSELVLIALGGDGNTATASISINTLPGRRLTSTHARAGGSTGKNSL